MEVSAAEKAEYFHFSEIKMEKQALAREPKYLTRPLVRFRDVTTKKKNIANT